MQTAVGIRSFELHPGVGPEASAASGPKRFCAVFHRIRDGLGWPIAEPERGPFI